MPRISLALFLSSIALSGCSGGTEHSLASRSHSSFDRMSEEERYLVAKGMAGEPVGRGFPLEPWVALYVREESPRVAAALERVLERAIRGPVVELLQREAVGDGSHAEEAAMRLLDDPRQAVRMYAVGALSRRNTRRAVECLQSVVREGRRGREVRIAAADVLAEKGETEWLSRWCREARDAGENGAVADAVSSIVEKRGQERQAPDGGSPDRKDRKGGRPW